MKKTVALFCALLIGTLNMTAYIFADEVSEYPDSPEKVVTLTGSRKSVRFGDDMVVKLDGINFKNSIGIKNLKFDYFTEVIDTTQELQKIVIPRFDARADGNDHGVMIRIMAIVQNGSSLRIVKDIKFLPDDGQERVEITRAELLEWSQENNYGNLPTKLFFNFSNMKNTEIDYGMTRVFYDMYQSAPFEFHYKVVEGTPYNGAVYQLYQGELSWYTTNVNNRTSVLKSVYPYFETSDIEVTANVTEGLKPGDLVELSIKVKNNSSLTNRFLWMGLEASGLEPVSVESQSRIDLQLTPEDWRVSGNFLNTPLYKNGAWITISPTDEYSVTQLFRITEDFNQPTLEVLPYLFANGAFDEREYNDGLTVYVDVEAEEPEEQETETETPTETPETQTPDEGGNNSEDVEEPTETPETQTPDEGENNSEDVEEPTETPETQTPDEGGNNSEEVEEPAETPETQTPDEGGKNSEEVEVPSLPVESPVEIPESPSNESVDTPANPSDEQGNDLETGNDTASKDSDEDQSIEKNETSKDDQELPSTGQKSQFTLYAGMILMGIACMLSNAMHRKKS
ncbi:hypothetical protein AOC36_10045 [Erysipelothrix larvae]|uniref:Gram-positive cocci surface proteins LPxTG domain-containing protein n=1 Tax=Erysipelothrix larvae TaxID=1514105 RepID=A0A0X8H1C4_9FIRM|nr:hypothetical protein [Erysipelothrix larvae]AMC94299.1 hypothetical protein AOC36_10045 [Erysipelothrix larvae]